LVEDIDKGDINFQFEMLCPKDISVGADKKVDIIEYNVIILTQSCDLEKK